MSLEQGQKGRCICKGAPTRRYYQSPVAGGGAHIIERCTVCGANARDAWVPHSEVIGRNIDPNTLPIDPWKMNGFSPARGEQSAFSGGAVGGSRP